MNRQFIFEAEPFRADYEFDEFIDASDEYDEAFEFFDPEFGESWENIPPNAVPAGEKYLDTSKLKPNPLRFHGGVGNNLALRWNTVPHDAQEIDVVIHLHGYIGRPPNGDTLRELVALSGLDLSGRARPTLAVIPRGRRITADEVKQEQEKARKRGKDPRKVRSDRYTFPALLSGEGAGLESVLSYALDWFARNNLGRSGGQSLRISRLIFTAHSGGGAALNALLVRHASRRVCNPEEVQAFDAFYGEVGGVKSWVTARLAKDRARVAGSRDLSGRDLMDSFGGGLRVIYGAGTRPRSCEVDAVLPRPGEALRAWYRAERTQVKHLDIPSKFGGVLLRDRAADLGLRSECGARSKGPSATPSSRKFRLRRSRPR